MDLHKLTVLRGSRPEKFRRLEQVCVDLERSRFTIQKGKTGASKRTLMMRAEAREIHLATASLRSVMKYVHVRQHDLDREMARLDRLESAPLLAHSRVGKIGKKREMKGTGGKPARDGQTNDSQ
jgi:hypothetical protein